MEDIVIILGKKDNPYPYIKNVIFIFNHQDMREKQSP